MNTQVENSSITAQVHKVSALHSVNTELAFPSHIPPPLHRIIIPTPRPIVQLLPKLEIPRPNLIQKPETVRLSTSPMPLSKPADDITYIHILFQLA